MKITTLQSDALGASVRDFTLEGVCTAAEHSAFAHAAHTGEPIEFLGLAERVAAMTEDTKDLIKLTHYGSAQDWSVWGGDTVDIVIDRLEGEKVRTREAIRGAFSELDKYLPSAGLHPLVGQRIGKWVEKNYPDLNKKTPEEIGTEALEAINEADSIEEAMGLCSEYLTRYFDAVKERSE